MSENPKFKREARRRRALRVRRSVRGSAARPRLSVFRSNRHIVAQIIDDENGKTLVAASSLKLEQPSLDGVAGKVAYAKAVGLELAKRARAAGVTEVVFDRAGYRYHGRVAALAQGARDGGLKF
jgi:large subunit ribosomal protein L18